MADWGNVASGAGTGALAGSAISPGWGTLIGGLAGGGLGLFGGGGKKDKFKSTLQQPGQQDLLQQIMAMIQGGGQAGQNYGQSQQYLSSLLGNDPEAYERFAAPMRQEFEQETLPGIAERFSGLGGGLGGGAAGSSGFGQAIGGAAAKFQSNIQNLFAQIRQNAAGQAMNQFNNLLSTGLGNYTAYQPGTPGLFSQAAAGIAQGVGSGLGQKAGQNISEGNWGFGK